MSEYLNKFLVEAAQWLIATSKFCLDTTQTIELYLTSQIPTEPEPPTEPVEPPVEPEPEPEPEPELSYFERTYVPSVDTQIIYVSSSTGSDTNDGLSESAPVKTVAKGLSLLRARDGHPDWLLFKRGDVWTGETFGNIEFSGRSALEPMVIGSYGQKYSPRPKFDTLDKSGINTYDRSSRPQRNLDYIVLCGLHFIASTRIPGVPEYNPANSPTGIRWLRGTNGLTIDDCKFEYYHTNIVIQAYKTVINNVELKNSVLLNSYSNDSTKHSQGFYAEKINRLLIEGCLIDNNGHNQEAPTGTPTIYNHGLYLQSDCSNVTVRNCVITRSSSHGLQIRPGGFVLNNFFWENPINLLVGYSDPSIEADVEGNVIAGGTNISPELPRCWGIEFKGQNPPNVALIDNIVANALAHSPNSRSIEDRSNVYYEGNIAYSWPPTGRFDNPDANYKNPDVSINNVELFDKMRVHSMDNPQVDVFEYLAKYRDGFTEV